MGTRVELCFQVIHRAASLQKVVPASMTTENRNTTSHALALAADGAMLAPVAHAETLEEQAL
jgi:hypothetical protein